MQRQETFKKMLKSIGEDTDELQREINRSYLSFAEYWRGANDSGTKDYSHSEYYRIHYRKLQQLNHHFHKNDKKSDNYLKIIMQQPMIPTGIWVKNQP
ncbi:MAG TPA: hypothetical protein PLD88_00745, partial [Candidatus Berkiella sp.]|nr:hypothetical protein [Candidatus Berkiella sp.]